MYAIRSKTYKQNKENIKKIDKKKQKMILK
jgi:hypothetical protein